VIGISPPAGRRPPSDENGFRPSEEQRRRQRGRSVAIAIVLGVMALLFYLVTIVKLGPGVLDRPM
jgi:hypothetical protein